MLSNRKWTLRPVAWTPLLFRLHIVECITIAHQGSWFHIRVQITFIKMEWTGMPLWVLWFMQHLQCLNCVILTVPYFTFSSFSNVVCIECLYGNFVYLFYVLILWDLHWRLISDFIDVISSLLAIAMFGFCETELLCILCVCFKCFFISSIACIISSVTIIQSPNNLLANVTCL